MSDLQQQYDQSNTEQVPLAAVQHNLSNILPTSSEIGNIWSSYLAETMSVCFLKSYVAKSIDPDIHTVLQRALDVSSQRVKTMKDIFNSINHPIPEAFGDEDVDSNAKQLFSESFTLLYTRLMHQHISLNYSRALSVSSRSDFRNFFLECINTSLEIRQKATEVLLAKGLLLKYPIIPLPDRVDFVHDDSYFGTNLGSIIGQKRPINALEIGHVFSLMETKLLLRTLGLGYSQVVKSEKIRSFLSKSKQIADEHLKTLGSFLADEDVSQPAISEILVTESKESPVSDKLILCHITTVTAYIIAYYGFALTSTSRIDLTSAFSDFVKDLLVLANRGGDLMIEAGWLERVPEAADRKELIQH